MVTFLSVYAPQSGLSDEVKDLFFDQLHALFFDQLHAVTARIPSSEYLIPCGDWNGHVGHSGTGYRKVFILFRRIMRKFVTDVKVIPGEEVVLQHQLLVCDMRIDVPPKSKCKFISCLKVWKLKDTQMRSHFQDVFNLHLSTSAGIADGATEDIWNNIKTGLLKTTEEVCGTTRPHRWDCKTW